MARLRHIALRCGDVAASRSFYELLGFEFVCYRGADKLTVDLADGDVNMTLIPHPGERPSLEEGEEYIHFGIIVDDAAKLWEQLRDAGAEILRDDVKQRNEITTDDAPTGSFKVADPDGNVIDVTDNLREWNYAL